MDVGDLPPTIPPQVELAELVEQLKMQNLWLERIAVILRRDREERPALPRVKIADCNMPFWNMVGLMVKAAIAAIPAWIILIIIGAFVSALCGGTSLLALLGMLAGAKR